MFVIAPSKETFNDFFNSYRYAWADRAKTVGWTERFAPEALGHHNKTVHRTHAKHALMKISSLENANNGPRERR
jgi:hypothetical protein